MFSFFGWAVVEDTVVVDDDVVQVVVLVVVGVDVLKGVVLLTSSQTYSGHTSALET